MSITGTILLITALEIAILSAVLAFFGGRGNRDRLVSISRIGVIAVFGLLSLSVILLLYAFFTHDFSLAYVASNSSRETPPLYLLTSFWAGNEGSLLLWAWLLSLCSVLILGRLRSETRHGDAEEAHAADSSGGIRHGYLPYVFTVIMAAESFFLILLSFIANPFGKNPVIPADGLGLNPVLENIGMLIHPPVIIAGYVLLTIPFAYAVAALIAQKMDRRWVLIVRRWVLVGWLFLGVGNLVGAWWAYNELGWGGYWNWDSVENAGLMPWLTATAVLHAITMQRTKGIFKAWNVLLIVLTFNLTIFGTLISRSDILDSLHTYGLSNMDSFYLTFLGIALLVPLGLLIYRRSMFQDERSNGTFLSKESSFLLANVILVISAFVVFLGTLFQWKTSFMNYSFGSVIALLIVLMGVCALINRHQNKYWAFFKKLTLALLFALIVAVILWLLDIGEFLAVGLFFICAFVMGTLLIDIFAGVKKRIRERRENPVNAIKNLIWHNRPRYGGFIVHFGIIVITIGIVGSSYFSVSEAAILSPGDSMNVDDYTLTYDNISSIDLEDRNVRTVTLLVTEDDKTVGRITPEIHDHTGFNRYTVENNINCGIVHDLYVIVSYRSTMDYIFRSDTLAFEVKINYLVTCIWIGGGILLLGALIALWPRGRDVLTV